MRRLLNGVACLMLIASAAAVAAETVATREVKFRVVYRDGSVDNMVARYVAYAQNASHNTGHAAHGLNLQDTRRCEIAVSSWIQRDVCIMSQATGDACVGKYRRVFNDQRTGGSNTQNFFTGNFKAKTCGEMTADINAYYGAIKSNAVKSIDDVVSTDIEELLETLKMQNSVKEIER